MFRVIGQVLNGCIAFILIASAWFQCDLMSGKARFHIHHIAFADVELLRDLADLLWLERFQPFFHAAQIKEQLALRLGGGNLDQPPVAHHELVDLGTYPVSVSYTHLTLPTNREV